jgi:hypothetical protein
MAAGLNIVESGRDNTLQTWWDAARELLHKKDRRGFDTLVFSHLGLYGNKGTQSFQQH